MPQDFKGISFPFRIGQKGGVVMSSVTANDVTHIVESLQQLLLTFKYERGMEVDVYSELDTAVFEPNDVSTQTLLEYQIRQAIQKWEKRVELIVVNIESDNAEIKAIISFKVIKYDSIYTEEFKVGDISVQSA